MESKPPHAASYWQGKVVAITGGSSGLGLQFAQDLASRGANVALIARDQDRLTASGNAIGRPQQTLLLSADITQPSDVELLSSRVQQHFGRVDGLINCAGLSSRGELLQTPPEEFQRLWELNFLALVRCTQAFAPALRESRGHLVNIGSLAAKIASRYLGAYPASKFPVAAFSQQLRLEVGREFHVLLVCPGPIARPDAGVRYEHTDVPKAAKQPGGGAKIRGLDAGQVVKATLKACERRKSELILPAKARILMAVAAAHPAWGDWLLGKFTS